MKTISFITVVTIIVAFELISFSYAPKNADHQSSINSERDTELVAPFEIVECNGLTLLKDRKVFQKNQQGQYVSQIHDIGYKTVVQALYNMVVENPLSSIKKQRISLTEPLNPIMYEMDENGNTISFHKEHPSGIMPWNEGKIPMTWHNQGSEYKGKKLPGNGSQITVIEIKGIYLKSGNVVSVYPIYAYETTDHSGLGEIIVIAIVKDKNERGTPDMNNVVLSYSNKLNKIKEWLGKTRRTVVRRVDVPDVYGLIEEKYNEWKVLLNTKQNKLKSLNGLSLKNTTFPNNSWYISQDEARKIVLRY